jgi:cytochrome c-type biogenesis protein CcmF
MKVGDEMNFLNKKIIFENVQIKDGPNYRTLIGEFKLQEKKNTFEFKPEIRVYSQPETITSEADILSTIFSDNFLVFSLIKDDGYFNVRYQFKPLMMWIWLSVLIMSFGGLLSLIKKNEK